MIRKFGKLMLSTTTFLIGFYVATIMRNVFYAIYGTPQPF